MRTAQSAWKQREHAGSPPSLARQCNHFCEELALELTGQAPPSWVNRLAAVARIGAFFSLRHFLQL